jgi:methylglutaconyl-CoA hydratase
MTMAQPAVLASDTHPIRLLTLNRPETRNALSEEMVKALDGALAAALADREVRVVVLTGAGKAFCAGADLKALAANHGRSSADDLRDSRRLQGLYLRMAQSSKPIVAAVNGPALAGGCGLAVLCDLVLCTPEARFGYPEVKVGFVAAMVLVFLQRAVGERKARELLLTGRPVEPAEAMALGLVQRVVPAAGLLEEALLEAQSLCASAPSSMAWTRELLRRTWGLPLEDALEMAAQVNALARSGPEMAEGIAAFLERRNPSWPKS